MIFFKQAKWKDVPCRYLLRWSTQSGHRSGEEPLPICIVLRDLHCPAIFVPKQNTPWLKISFLTWTGGKCSASCIHFCSAPPIHCFKVSFYLKTVCLLCRVVGGKVGGANELYEDEEIQNLNINRNNETVID